MPAKPRLMEPKDEMFASIARFFNQATEILKAVQGAIEKKLKEE